MVLRKTIGGAFAGSAQVLSVASKLLDATAKTLRPGSREGNDAADTPPRVERVPAPPPADGPSEPIGTEAAVIAAVEAAPEPGRIVEPPPTPLLDEVPHMRTSATHIEELAAKPVGQVVAAIADLSTDELRLLTEYELEHKNRRTVMVAIERALVPSGHDT